LRGDWQQARDDAAAVAHHGAAEERGAALVASAPSPRLLAREPREVNPG